LNVESLEAGNPVVPLPRSNLISPVEACTLVGEPNVRFVDASWYLPVQKRDARQEYAKMRIPGAVFFDIDLISDQTSNLPHMLPKPQEFAEAVSALGVSDTDDIIVYDALGMFSAPRAWWTFKTMGADNVRVLEGGFDRWKESGLPVETGRQNPPRPRLFATRFDASRVADQSELITDDSSLEKTILDARPGPRFRGEMDEPRAGLRRGHIPGSKSLPFNEITTKTGTLKRPGELIEIFERLGIKRGQPLVTSCGSGVTAAVLALALNEVGYTNVSVYDGSWAQWGLPNGPDIETR